ncbi:MAG TPA: FtsX-like permease family protein [Vicinamibacterales bacterium]|nr:FtsX-like permease family protein [Vicinamibacterales bacterium]
MRRAWSRLRTVLRRWVGRGASDEELSEELRAFIEHDADSKIRSGMTPEEARRVALIELGGAEQVKEHVREARAGARLDGIVRDIRYAMRSLGRSPGFSSSVIGNLSLGLAAMIVAFALINGSLRLSSPSIQDPDRLVEIGILENRGPLVGRAVTALADYPDVARVLGMGMPSLDGLASVTESDVAVTLPQPRSLPAAFVSANYFDVLGVRPEIGRTFAPGEEAESPVAIISGALWMREFGGDPSVIGQPIQTGGQVFEVIGVTPPGFAGTQPWRGIDLWLPIAFVDRVAMDDPLRPSGAREIRYVGRMREGFGVERVEAELAVVAGRLGVAHPAGDPAGGRLVASADDSVERVTVEVSGLSGLGDDAVEVVAYVLPIPLLVLVLACVNAANLLLVRASGRSREVAVRLALGASRLRLVRQLIVESLVLAIAAALLALLVAWSGLQVIAASFVLWPMPLDGTVVAGALVTALLTALGFGLVPALRAAGQRPSAALGTSPAGSGGTRAESRGRRVLVAGQIALSLGLLASVFQLISTLESEPPGTDPDRMLVASFDLAQLRASSVESNAFYAALLDRVSTVPGVEAAGLSGRNLLWTSGSSPFSNQVFLSGPDLLWTADAQRGTLMGPARRSRFTLAGSAGGELLRALGLDVLHGRGFTPADRRDIPEVAIVTERLASMMQGGALDRSLHVSTVPGSPAADVRIVGIVESPVEIYGQEVAAIFFPSPFFPSQFQNGTARTLYVRAGGEAGPLAPALREIVAQIDPRVPLLELAMLDEKIRSDTRLQGRRVLGRVAAVLGIVALLLASLGLYGVTSYSVAMRVREIAVRMALGARADRVVAMFLRQALTLATIGSVLGGLVGIAAGLVVRTQMFGVPGVDIAALAGAAALLATAMLLSSILPAWRAARLDPMAVLRQE